MRDLGINQMVDELLQQFPSFVDLEFDKKEFVDLIKKGDIITAAKGEQLTTIGGTDFNIYYLISGVVKYYFKNENKDGDVVVGLGVDGQLIFGGWENDILKTPADIGIATVTDCVLLQINTQILKDFFFKNPTANIAYQQITNHVMGNFILMLKSRINRKPEDHLFYVANHCQMGKVIGKIPDKIMAEVLGITPVSYSRLKKRLAVKA